jgi:SecD/SecF fusion protein
MRRGLASTGVLILLVVGLLVVAALIVALKYARDARSSRDIGTKLLYEADPVYLTIRRPTPEMLERTVAALDERINSGGPKKARVQRLGEDRIEVAIYGSDERNVERIRNQAERAGTLEFRILANSRDHKDLIDRARNEETARIRSKTPDENGNYPELARWVTVKGSERFKDKERQAQAEQKKIEDIRDTKAKEQAEKRLARDKKRADDLLRSAEAKRTINKGDDKEIDQVLVVTDPQNVTGAYLTDTSAGTDRRGKPCVNFRFNAEGAAKFAALTGNHLPEQGGQFTRKLGILLDDELDSAPSIQSTISDRGEITGDFTKDEIQDLVATLNAGSLPFRLILVHQMTVGPTNPGP